jgi:uncharacterized delta-60 repeat protein
VFSVNTDGTGFTNLYNFTGGSDGANPYAGLVLSGTTLYGTTEYGGNYGNGTVFSVNTDGTGFAVLKEFSGSDGANPVAALVLSGTTLYGTTEYGGNDGFGTVFSVGSDGSSYTVLTNFVGGDGANPYASLTLSGSTLYGTTGYGGSSGNGTVFSVNTDDTGYAVLYNFTESAYGTNADGANPAAGLVLSGTTLYGTAVSAGNYGYGTVFAVNTDGTGFTNLYSFTATDPNTGTNSDGANPYANLTLSGSTLYGTTVCGGSSGNGTVFAVNTDGTGFTNLYTFTAIDPTYGTNSDGAIPAALVLSGATLYGTTGYGGSSGNGTVFSVNIDGTGFTVLKQFNGDDGATPNGGLVLSGSTLYGTTYGGGSSGNGTVFSVNTDGTGFTNLYSFTGGSDGANPNGGLVLYGATLYGTTPYCGGNVFQINTDGSEFAVLKYFSASDGAYPNAGLVLSDTTFYGVTVNGGGLGNGVLFSLSPGPPMIASPPAGQTAQAGSTVDFQVDAAGYPPPSYQWFFNGTNAIAGATNSILELTNALFAQSGAYTVVITNAYGSVTSLVATLIVQDPSIITQPVSQTVHPMQTAVFSVVAGGTTPWSFQWYKDGVSLNDGGNISGAQSSTLTLSSVSGGDVGAYWMVISNVYGSVTSAVAVLTVNLAVADSFNPGANGEVECLALQPDGKIIVGGYFTTLGGYARYYLGRLNADGTVDKAFDPSPNNSVWTIGFQDSGKIIVGGYFTTLGGQPHGNIGRLYADGTVDTTFSAAANLGVFALAVQTDGKILVGGSFNTLDEQTRNNLGRLNADGTLDTTFNPGADFIVLSLALQADGKILVGGLFSTLGGQTRNYLGRLNANGTVDTTFNLGADSGVHCLAVQPDGKILVGGDFTMLGGQPRSGIGRLNADGTLDTAFNPGANNEVNSFALQPDGRILVGGSFTMLGGQPRSGIGRLNADGTLDGSFNPGVGGFEYNWVNALALEADGKIFVGGYFTMLGGQPRNYIGRLVVYDPPGIPAPLQSQTAEDGCDVNLAARVTGYPPPTYQWFVNGNAIAGCTNSVLSLSGVQASNIGAYTLVVSNAAGAITSAPIMLNVIPIVERRPVPGVEVTGEVGSSLHVEYTDALGSPANWETMATMTLSNTSQFYFDVSEPLPPERFYRAWQTGTPSVLPSLNLPYMVPAITLAGNVGDSLRLDYINAIGPTNAWVTLDTVTLTNTSQLYFDVSAIGQPRRLYRIVPVP